jgi:5-methyltetrahydropteroyltriglutamate--homocysteine methyltransferase
VEDTTEIQLSGSKLWEEYAEAKAQGIETKPVVIGAYTMLKLCRYTGKKTAKDFVEAIVKAYQQLLNRCEENQIQWVQLDEPALVQDMDEQDRKLFCRIYDEILSVKKNCHVLLQTYFGDVRDIYPDLTQMAFDGIGLDFIEGKETVNLIKKYGFPQDKKLFAGLINGKNIWKNHYEKTLKILAALRERNIPVVLSTSCSLLHVPYTLQHESKLAPECLAYFAFAEGNWKNCGKSASWRI